MVERRKRLSIPVESAAQRTRLLAIPDRGVAIRGVLDMLVENDADTQFVYSCIAVQRFKDYTGKRIDSRSKGRSFG